MKRGPCFVYVMGSVGGPVKIGIAGDPAKRLRQVQHASPTAVLIFHLRRFASREIAAQVEARAHAVLSDLRLRGEWFSSSPDEATAAIAAAAVWVKGRRSNVFGPSARRTVHLRTVR
ncbi:GIY-YIG nuclease family protein [Methylobacterium sp. J-092]|uniref:GIY-YIG nuclease family protein n=1 Tax=Methylobacterium sp. J-092 TaxID=2836667 RepID=UPI001FBAC997|nr:GIY-YIG nuclease family protein [Methylobacterium sp. J-092]MCJ2009786.1 GIY-YIG nuclease family protein [Methylobacterium sp. J-092]